MVRRIDSGAGSASPAYELTPRIRERLECEPVVWLSSVRPDGAPHLLPLWFTFDGEAITIYSKPDAQKVRNIRRDPRVMVAVGAARSDFDVTLLEGRAEVVELGHASLAQVVGLERYREPMRLLGIDVEEFLATYSQPIRILPQRVLQWGRPGWLTRAAKIVPEGPAAAPTASEPARRRSPAAAPTTAVLLLDRRLRPRRTAAWRHCPETPRPGAPGASEHRGRTGSSAPRPARPRAPVGARAPDTPR